LVKGLGPQLGTDLAEPLSERFGGVDPEDAAGVVVPFLASVGYSTASWVLPMPPMPVSPAGRMPTGRRV